MGGRSTGSESDAELFEVAVEVTRTAWCRIARVAATQFP